MTVLATSRSVLWALLCCIAWCGCSDEANEWRVVGTLERDRLELVAEERASIIAIHVREGQQVRLLD